MSRSLWLAAALIVVTSIAALADTSPETFSAGDVALSKFNLDGALTAYREAVRLTPNNYEANWKLARALADKATLTKDRAEQKQFCVEAEQFARTAVRLLPKDSKGHTYLATTVGKLALYEGGKRKVELSKEVKVEAEQALELNPQEDLAYHVLGIWHREMVELNWMLKKFAEAFYGNFPPASLDDAEKNLRKAVELAPNLVPHRVQLGITLAAERKWADAKKELDQSLAMKHIWVTDEYYWELARKKLEEVKKHQ